MFLSCMDTFNADFYLNQIYLVFSFIMPTTAIEEADARLVVHVTLAMEAHKTPP